MSASAIARCSLARGGGLQCLVRMSLYALVALCVVGKLPVARAATIDGAAAARFAQLALDCVHREYPNKIAHVLASDADAKPPRELTPAFFGCYDWHSAVHAHWLLARVAKQFPNEPAATAARAALARSLTRANLGTEAAYLRGAGRTSFERPYGLAWLLQLCTELRGWDDPQAREWLSALAPLESEAASRFKGWLPNLRYPIRIGEHDQTAFAFGLVWDWSQRAADTDMQRLLRDKAQQFYQADRDCPLLRAVGPGLPVTVPRGGGLHAPRTRTRCLCKVARCIHPGIAAQWFDGLAASR